MTRIIKKSHHKIDLVIVTSLSQTKDIKSLRLSIRRLGRKDWTPLSFCATWSRFNRSTDFLDGELDEALLPLDSIRVSGEWVGRVVSGWIALRSCFSGAWVALSFLVFEYAPHFFQQMKKAYMPYTDLVPPRINWYYLVLTQYQQVPTIAVFYWQSTHLH